MQNLHTPAQIEQFKRDAKRLARDNSLSHTAALDKVAATRGYPNWSVLMKHIAPPQGEAQALHPERRPYLFARTVEEMRQAMRKANPPDGEGFSPDRLRNQVHDLSGQFISASNALDFAIAYIECVLSVPRFSIHSLSLAYYEMRCWLPYCVHSVQGEAYILVGRDYKPVGMVQRRDHVDYAAFTQVHLHVTTQMRKEITFYRRDGAEGYFYDGSPWSSRAFARLYLAHLKAVRNSLTP